MRKRERVYQSTYTSSIGNSRIPPLPTLVFLAVRNDSKSLQVIQQKSTLSPDPMKHKTEAALGDGDFAFAQAPGNSSHSKSCSGVKLTNFATEADFLILIGSL